MRKEPYHQPLLTRHSAKLPLAAKLAGECALLVFSGGVASGVELAISRVGTNIVLSWPASAGNVQLQLTPSLTADGWRTAQALPVTNHGTVSVTLRPSGVPHYFRLKDLSGEKDPMADKDPSEKDPASDKPSEKGADEKCPDLEKSPCLA